MKKYLAKSMITLLLSLILVVMVAASVNAAGNWKQTIVRFSATAGETLATGNVVCIAGSDGKAYKADANDSALRPAVGIIGKGGATGATVEVVAAGILAGQTAASPGVRVYLSETAGAITATAPTNAQTLGWVMPGAASAATSTTYFIQVQIPTSAGAAY